jgi:hypothetical protein
LFPKQQTIREWSVIGTNRLSGRVYNRPGKVDGGNVVTTPVRRVELRRGATNLYPVAITNSGSEYLLGDPARHFGLDKAEDFVIGLLPVIELADQPIHWADTEREPLSTQRDPDTVPGDLLAMLPADEDEWAMETIIIEATTFQPLE